MRKYETIFVLKSNLDEARRIELIERFTGVIASEGGEVTEVNEWGNRKLAYEIEKQTEGYYVLVNFNAPADLPKELERHYKIADEVLRYIVVNLEEK